MRRDPHPAVSALRALADGAGPLSREPAWTPSRARCLAEIAHAGQVDKAGEPYIGHPARVARYARQRACRVDRDDVEVVAWLHDVLEDTPATADDLRDAGMPRHLVDALMLLDHSDDRPYDDYVDEVAQHPLARAVKLADLFDNMDPDRLAELEPDTRGRLQRKYTPVQARLAALDAGEWMRAAQHGDASGDEPPLD